ncbi:MAG: hypothetical protein AB7U81_04425 [Thiohalomonadaceae bacterium]
MVSNRAENPHELVEPPRDGEFFLDEAYTVDERLAGAIERGIDGLGRIGVGIVQCVLRYPLLSLGAAVAVGVLASSAVFQLI